MEKPNIIPDKIINDRLKEFQGWIYKEKSLQRNWWFKNFNEAISFVNQIAYAAEKCNHHPEILIHNYNQVKITVNTHAVGGEVTNWDFDLIAEIEKIKS